MEKCAVKLTPSILAEHFARLAERVAEAERAEADRIHVDGHTLRALSMFGKFTRADGHWAGWLYATAACSNE
jgi:hypothetical protein